MGKAVVLLSGGLDSTVTSYLAKEKGYELYALTFDYGQRHKKELEYSKRTAQKIAKEHKVLKIDLTQLGGSSLTSPQEVPQQPDYEAVISNDEIPSTYVPARNTILLSFALAYAEVSDAKSIFIGANSLDYSGYPDCRPEYFERFQSLVDVATKKTVEGEKISVVTPILQMDKSQIVMEGIRLGVPFEDTWSCYNGGEKACGKCDSCLLRLNGFKKAGIKDPLQYQDGR